jgi:hypothetical protein
MSDFDRSSNVVDKFQLNDLSDSLMSIERYPKQTAYQPHDNDTKNTLIISPSNNNNENDSTMQSNDLQSISLFSTYKRKVLNTLNANRQVNRHELELTKTLVALTLTYICLNLPYLLIWNIYAKRLSEFSQTGFKENIYTIYSFWKLAEILHVCNYSLTGILFLRFHYKWLEKKKKEMNSKKTVFRFSSKLKNNS